MELWKAPLEILIRTTTTLVHEAVFVILAEVFANSTDFQVQLTHHINAFLDGVETRQQERLESLLGLETLEPMTLAKESFNQHAAEALELL